MSWAIRHDFFFAYSWKWRRVRFSKASAAHLYIPKLVQTACTAVVIMCVQPLLFINLMFLVACIVIFLYFQWWLLQFFDNYIDFFKLAREMENRFEMLELKNWMKVTCIEWQLIMVQGGCRPQQPNTLKGQGTYCLYLQTKCIFSVNNLAQHTATRTILINSVCYFCTNFTAYTAVDLKHFLPFIYCTINLFKSPKWEKKP